MPSDTQADGTGHEPPGGVPGPVDPAETAWSFAALLGPADLPGPGWEVVEERSWPTGRLDPTSEKSRRALDGGGITAWRKLGRAPVGDSGWVEVVPYATDADAAVSLQQVPTFFVGPAQPDEVVVEGRTVTDRPVPGVTDTWVFEKWTTTPDGDVRARYVAGAAGRVLFLVCLARPARHWEWDDVVGVASAQAARVVGALERPPAG